MSPCWQHRKKLSLSKRGIDSQKNAPVPLENLLESGTAKQVFAHVTSILAGNSICDGFWKRGNDCGCKTCCPRCEREADAVRPSSAATRIFAATLILQGSLTPIICTSLMWSQGITSRDCSAGFRPEVAMLLRLFNGRGGLCTHRARGRRALEAGCPEGVASLPFGVALTSGCMDQIKSAAEIQVLRPMRRFSSFIFQD